MAKNKGRDLKNPFEQEKEYSLFDDEIIAEAMKKSGLDKANPKDRVQLLRAIELMKEEYDKDPEGFLDYMDSIYDEMDEDGEYPYSEFPITGEEWTQTHPFQLKCGSDLFYAKVATEILRGFESLNIDRSIPKGVLRTAAKSAAAYLEDIISETGVWNAVRTMYRKKFNRILPFFDVDADDYFDDDLNLDDLKVLVWQAFNMCGKYYERTFSPLSVAVERMAIIAYDILIDRFEEAKPAKRIKDKVKSVFKTGDYFQLRTLGLWLAADNPLTAAPFMRAWMMENAVKTMHHLSKHEHLEGLDPEATYYNEEARLGWLRYMSINGCGSNELLSEMAELYGYPELATKLLTVKEIRLDAYKIDNAEGKYVTISNEIGKTYSVTKDSFRFGVDWKNMKGVICTLYKFGDEYMSNGMSSFMPEFPDWDKKTKETPVNNDLFIKRCAEVVDRNKGRRVFYCKNVDEIQKIMGNDMKPLVYNPDTNEVTPKDNLDVDNLLLLLSSTDGPLLKPDDCGIFKDPKNPFYLGRNIPEIEMGGFNFICNTILADDVIDYIVGKKLLPNAYMYASQGKRVGKRIVQDNMGFLMRFARVSGYPHPDDYDIPDFDEEYDDDVE